MRLWWVAGAGCLYVDELDARAQMVYLLSRLGRACFLMVRDPGARDVIPFTSPGKRKWTRWMFSEPLLDQALVSCNRFHWYISKMEGNVYMH